MKDIIAAQHIHRRSKPSLLSTASKHKSIPHSIPGIQDNSFFSDQHLPKRKKKRLLELFRTSVKKQDQVFFRKKEHFLREKPVSSTAETIHGDDFFLPRVTTRPKEISLYREPIREKDHPGFLGAAGRFFAHFPKAVLLGGLLCLVIACFVLYFNYIPEPEPPEDRAVREHNGRVNELNTDEGDIIPLDMTEAFAWLSYKVSPGDSVEGIARHFGLSIDAVIASNELRNVRRLLSGSTIRIPNMDGIPYTVKSGDSYAKIAES